MFIVWGRPTYQGAAHGGFLVARIQIGPCSQKCRCYSEGTRIATTSQGIAATCVTPLRAYDILAMLLQASQEGREGEDSDAELPPEQLLPGMQHLSVAFRETVYTGGDKCEGPHGEIERQGQGRRPVWPVHIARRSRRRIAQGLPTAFVL